MFAQVKVITNASRDEVIAQKNGTVVVKVTASPERGKANKRVMTLLAEHFNVPKSAVLIVKGKYQSKKVINIIA